jgi:type IV pilus assembly protein PilV
MKGSTNSRGFSLIEILIAIVILSISLLALAALMVTTTQNNSFGAHMSEATTFAQDMLERLRVSPWANVMSGADQVTGSTGINYDRNWVVSPNPITPNDTLRTVTITINWNDKVDHSITVLSAISQ